MTHEMRVNVILLFESLFFCVVVFVGTLPEFRRERKNLGNAKQIEGDCCKVFCCCRRWMTQAGEVMFKFEKREKRIDRQT